jgi:hypothetical protein
LALTPHAHAFGGFWSSRTAPVKQSAQRILFIDNPDATLTAIVELKYTGAAAKFAWLIPVPGKPKVEVSSNTVFERLDAATAPQYWLEVTRESSCAPREDAGSEPTPGYMTEGGADAGGPAGLSSTRGSVGPYDYSLLELDASLGDRSKQATDWLVANGYDLTDLDSKVLDAYLKDGLNLLAFKLVKGADAGAIRPVVLTYEGERPILPIRAGALAAQDDMGVLVWVLGPSQAVPENTKSLVLNDALIDWLSGPRFVGGTPPSGGSGPFGEYVSKPSNYDALVSAAADQAGGHGFVTELAQPASQFRDKIWSLVDEENFASFSSQTYADGIDALTAAQALYTGWDGFSEAVRGAATRLPMGVSLEQLMQQPEAYRDAAPLDTAKFLELLDAQVVKPVSDSAALLARAPYLTRLYSTLSAKEMTLDPSFVYNFDLAQISNVHIARQRLSCSAGQPPEQAPWRVELPQGGVVLGEGHGAWPLALGTLPANLKIVTLGTQGSGSVVEDHSAEIGKALRERAGSSAPESLMPGAPRTGLTIGGSQSVKSYEPSAQDRPKGSSADSCSVSHAARRKARVPALWLLLAGALFVRGWRRRPRIAQRDATSGRARA